MSYEWKSKRLFQGIEGVMRRALYKSIGIIDEEFKRPMVGIVNTFNEAAPGHFHLENLAKAVKAGVWQEGGTPFEFGTFATCGGIAIGPSGTENIKYELPIRDVIAASIEIMTKVHLFDGLVLLSSCDSIIPGELMAAARLNIPAIMVTGGVMPSSHYKGKKMTQSQLDEKVLGAFYQKSISEDELFELENYVCPGPGACPSLGTANTMQILCEALGIALPYSSILPATSGGKLRIAKESGKKIVNLIKENIKPSDIMSYEAFENAIIVYLAVGGSTNVVLHLPSIAAELGIPVDLESFGRFSKRIPCICNVIPNGPYDVNDLNDAGGVPAVMRNLMNELNLDVLTVTGKKLKRNIQSARIYDDKIIRPVSHPISIRSALSILKGNIAPNGAIARLNTVPDNMLKHKGPARVFNSDEDGFSAIQNNQIEKGDILVIRYEGPKGAPGMREVMLSSEALVGIGIDVDVALITDGRFSGFCRGPIIGHISPEGMIGGPIAIIKNDDLIEFDIPNGTLNLCISDDEINERFKYWTQPKRKVTSGFLTIYSRLAEQAEKGAAINTSRLL